MNTRRLSIATLAASLVFAPAQFAYSQENDAETKALDSTATQWSFQFAYQTMPDYFNDDIGNGQARPTTCRYAL